jgi:ABC-type nitrate/sulfonate/bicarbonate transport system permease component
MKVVLIFLASLFPIVLNTYSGVRSIDRVQFDTAADISAFAAEACQRPRCARL